MLNSIFIILACAIVLVEPKRLDKQRACDAILKYIEPLDTFLQTVEIGELIEENTLEKMLLCRSMEGTLDFVDTLKPGCDLDTIMATLDSIQDVINKVCNSEDN